ncbi:MAG TPA: acetyl-CoA carboxylase biotin carboxyl carrier protein [Candidatus Wallbacteria bacterium]|nr:acetyl-CoA carboxylase biotin carboxyl carrier protein [Candidatus Wallbacteria bacterium]
MPVKKKAKSSPKSKTVSQPVLASEKKISNPGELFNLIKYLEAEKVDEFDYSDADFSVSLKRTVKEEYNGQVAAGGGILNLIAAARAQAAQASPEKRQPENSGNDQKKSPAPPAEDESKFKFIESPIIGTFYRAPSPTSPAYVEVGQRVKKGQVVCIVEAMKLMNEIKSEYDGVIERLCVENGTLIQAKQRLFYVLPE